jgi:hypothetical protein
LTRLLYSRFHSSPSNTGFDMPSLFPFSLFPGQYGL